MNNEYHRRGIVEKRNFGLYGNGCIMFGTGHRRKQTISTEAVESLTHTAMDAVRRWGLDFLRRIMRSCIPQSCINNYETVENSTAPLL